jgi:hypothetical protein
MVSAVTKYATSDGKLFDTKEEALAHDSLTTFQIFKGLTPEIVKQALDGGYPELADALEAIGSRIARARLKSGVKKRVRKTMPPTVDFSEMPAGNGAANLPM